MIIPRVDIPAGTMITCDLPTYVAIYTEQVDGEIIKQGDEYILQELDKGDEVKNDKH